MTRILGVALLMTLNLFCTSAPKTVGTASSNREVLFPLGTYRHKVELKIPVADGSTREISLDGVVALKSDRIQVIGISAFGTTEFKISEERVGGKITIETFRDSLKKAEPRILEYYSVLRKLLNAKMNQPGVITDSESGSTFSISNFDHNQIPLRLEMKHPAFSAVVRVVGYEI